MLLERSIADCGRLAGKQPEHPGLPILCRGPARRFVIKREAQPESSAAVVLAELPPASRARLAAARTPAAGPDSIMRTGKRRAWAALMMPPLDCMISISRP